MGDAAAISEHLEACFRLVHTERMDGVPILNDALEVRAVGTHAWNGFWLSILITPWFINVVLLPQEPDGEAIRTGEKRMFGFPAGSFESESGEKTLRARGDYQSIDEIADTKYGSSPPGSPPRISVISIC